MEESKNFFEEFCFFNCMLLHKYRLCSSQCTRAVPSLLERSRQCQTWVCTVCADLAINYMGLLLFSAMGVQITLNLEWLQQYKPNTDELRICIYVCTDIYSRFLWVKDRWHIIHFNLAYQALIYVGVLQGRGDVRSEEWIFTEKFTKPVEELLKTRAHRHQILPSNLPRETRSSWIHCLVFSIRSVCAVFLLSALMASGPLGESQLSCHDCQSATETVFGTEPDWTWSL